MPGLGYTKPMRFIGFSALTLLLALTSPAWAQAPGAGPPGQVRAQGKDIKEAPPPEAPPAIIPAKPPDFRAELRNILMDLTLAARKRNKNFIVLLRDGAAILEKDYWEYILEEINDPRIDDEKRVPMHGLMRPLARALDGVVEDQLFCGDMPDKERDIRRTTLAELKKLNKRILSVDTCMSKSAPDALAGSKRLNTVPYIVADVTALDTVPAAHPPYEHPNTITTLAEVKNFLALLDGRKFPSKAHALMALQGTNHDMLIIDGGLGPRLDEISKSELYQLKFKKIGGKRLVLARLPVTIATSLAPYWRPTWKEGDPAWLSAVDPTDPERYFVDYRHAEWKKWLGFYLDWILRQGFDGVMFDETQGWRHYETVYPLD